MPCMASQVFTGPKAQLKSKAAFAKDKQNKQVVATQTRAALEGDDRAIEHLKKGGLKADKATLSSLGISMTRREISKLSGRERDQLIESRIRTLRGEKVEAAQEAFTPNETLQSPGQNAPKKSFTQMASEIKTQNELSRQATSVGQPQSMDPTSSYVQYGQQLAARRKQAQSTQQQSTPFLQRPIENIKASIPAAKILFGPRIPEGMEIAGGSPPLVGKSGQIFTIPSKIQKGAAVVKQAEQSARSFVGGLPIIRQTVSFGQKVFSTLPGKVQTTAKVTKDVTVATGEAYAVVGGTKFGVEAITMSKEEKDLFKREGASEAFRIARSDVKFEDGLVTGFAKEGFTPFEVGGDKGAATTRFQQNLLSKGIITQEELPIAQSAGQKRFAAETAAETAGFVMAERRTEVIGKGVKILQELGQGGVSQLKRFKESLPTFARLSTTESVSQATAEQVSRGGEFNPVEFGYQVGVGTVLGTGISATRFSIADEKIINKPVFEDSPVFKKTQEPTLNDVKSVKPIETMVETPAGKSTELIGITGSPFEKLGDEAADFTIGTIKKGRRVRTQAPAITLPETSSKENPFTGTQTQPVVEPITDIQTQPVVEPVVNPFTQTQSAVNPFTQTQTQVQPFVQPQVQPLTSVQPQSNVFTGKGPVFFPGLGGGGKKILGPGKKSRSKSKGIFAPSVTAVALNIKSPASKVEKAFGLGLRGLQ